MHGLWSNFFSRKDDRISDRVLLKNTKIFASLSKRQLDSVARIVYKRFFEAGEPVFQQGDPGVGMYIIENGVIQIMQMPAEHMLAELNAGDFFGEIALLNETPRSASAIAKTDCSLLCVSQPDLLGLINREPKLGVKVLTSLSKITGQRVIRLDQDILNLHQQLEQLSTNGRATASDHEKQT